MQFELSGLQEKFADFIFEYGTSFIGALVTLIVGLWIIKIFIRLVNRGFDKSKMDAGLKHFLLSLLSIGLKILLFISVASTVGIQTTSFIAVLGAAGLAIGLALQGSLANFAGGMLILMFKPFRVGDFVEAAGHMGTVRNIQIFNTIMNTPDNKRIIIPNGTISSESITNFSAEEIRRVDMTFGIGYGDDIKKAKDVLWKLIGEDERILKEPEPMVVVGALGESSVDFIVRVWCNTADYWGIFFSMQENVKLAFDAEGISIPFPQRDVHLFQEK